MTTIEQNPNGAQPPGGAPAGGDLEHPETTMTTETVTEDLRKLLGGEDPEEPAPDQGQPSGEGNGDVINNGAEDDEIPAEERTAWPETAQKRVDKLTAQKHELREANTSLQSERDRLAGEMEELRGQLEEAQAQTVAPATSNDPLSFVKTPQQLSEYVDAVKSTMRDIEDYLDGALPGEKLEKFTKWATDMGAHDGSEFNPGVLKKLKRTAQDTLTEIAPKKAELMQRETQLSAMADKRFPWMNDRKSAEYGVLQQVLKATPEIRSKANWKTVAAAMVYGILYLNGQAKAAPGKNGNTNGNGGAAANGGRRTAPATSRLPGTTVVLPQRTAGDGADTVEALRQKAIKSKNPKDYERLLAAQLRPASQ